MGRSKIVALLAAALLTSVACSPQTAGRGGSGPLRVWPAMERLANLLDLDEDARQALGASVASDELEDQFNPFEGANFAPLAEMEIVRGSLFVIQDASALEARALACPEGEQEEGPVQVLFCTSNATPQGDLAVVAIQTARPLPMEIQKNETMEVGVAVVNPDPAKNNDQTIDDGVNKGAQLAFGNSGSDQGPVALGWIFRPGQGIGSPNFTVRSILIEDQEGTGTHVLILPVSQLLDRMGLPTDTSAEAAPLEQIEFRLYTCYAGEGTRPDITYDRLDVTGERLREPIDKPSA